MTPVLYRVEARHQELADTVTIRIAPIAGQLADPKPGQFEMLLAFGVGEVPISISGLGNGSGELEHTIRSVGAVTKALCTTAVGDVIGVRGPFGVGWDLDRATGHDLLIVAGGLGLAPLRPAMLEALTNRHRFGRLVLLVGARDPGSLMFVRELEQWRGRFDIDVAVTVDAAPPSWRGDVGVVTKLLSRAPVDFGNTTAVVCGPEVMMRFVAAGLADRGVPPGQILLSMERNMRCAIGHCGHCQLGPEFVCKDGPVFPWDRMEKLMLVRER
ncbi:MAG: FAD/NAD(P)-binding protein [Acidimicrobiia bacterium]|nr:FAD/NAD(P)-binding protein [Acidimicrobiia bacterium]